jgi:hypothetical protein
MIVTAGPNEAASPTIQVGAGLEPDRKGDESPGRRALRRARVPRRCASRPGGPTLRSMPSALPARRARTEQTTVPIDAIHDPGDRVDLDPGHRLESHVGGDRHERERARARPVRRRRPARRTGSSAARHRRRARSAARRPSRSPAPERLEGLSDSPGAPRTGRPSARRTPRPCR